MTRCKINFTTTAHRDLAAVLGTIAENSGARVAARWRGRLLKRASALVSQPNLGAHDDNLGPGRRRLVVEPYLIVYEFQSADEIAILRVIHGARDLPSLFNDSNHE